MSDAGKPFNFGSFVPGFDFLKNLAAGSASSASSAVPGLQGLASWVAPTLSVEEVDKRIRELKTVQFWLEQNLTALKATIQALEVQKMTLSTLRGMNVRMEDLASSFTRAATMTPSMTPAPAKLKPGKNTVTVTATDPVSGKPVDARVLIGYRDIAEANVPFELEVKKGEKREEIWVRSSWDRYHDTVVAPAGR